MRLSVRRMPWPALLAALVPVVLLLTPIRNLDLWWHLDSGRWMLEHGRYLGEEVRSFTFAGAPWPNFAWLFQVVVAAIERAGGGWGLLALKAVSWWALFALLFRLAGPRGAPLSWWLACALLAWQLFPYLHLRPHLFEALLLAATLGLLRLPRSRANLAAGALLVLVWANVHASAVVGAAAIGLHALFGPRADWPGWGALARRLPGALLPAAMLLLTPNGAGLFEVLLGHADAALLGAYIREWFPVQAWPPFLFAALAAAGALAVLRRGGLAPGEALLLVVFVWLAADSRRFLFELALVAFRPLALAIGTGLAAAGRVRGAALGVASLAGVLALFPPPWPWREHRSDDYPVARRLYPVAAVAVLDAVARGEGRPLRVWNHYGWGGWLGWASSGRLRVAIDGRTPTVFPEDWMLEAALARHRPELLRRLLDRHDADAVVLRRTAAPMPLPPGDPDWALVAYDARSLVWLRRALALRHGLPPIPFDPGISLARLDPAWRDAAEHAVRALLERAPGDAVAWRHLAELLALRADAEAPERMRAIGEALRRARRLAPDDPLVRLRLAQWAARRGDPPEAVVAPLWPWARDASARRLAGHETAFARLLVAHGAARAALRLLAPPDPGRRQALDRRAEVWRLRARAEALLGRPDRAARARRFAALLSAGALPAQSGEAQQGE